MAGDQEQTDSDEFIKRTCDPCKMEHEEKGADGYCKVCKEYLCKKCESFHRKFQATRGHKIVHGILMPRPVKKSMTTCHAHMNNPVTFFCKQHQEVICTVCQEGNHKDCSFVLPVEIFSNKEIDKEEIDAVRVDVKSLNSEYKSVFNSRKEDIENFKKQRDIFKGEVGKLRNDFNELLDKLEENAMKRFDDRFDAELKTVTNEVNICHQAIETLSSVTRDVGNALKTEDNLATFSAFTKANRCLGELSAVLKRLKSEAYTVQMELVPDPRSVEALNTLENLGEVKIEVIPKTFENQLRHLKRDNMKVVETKVHSVRMDDDDPDHDCEVTGAVFLDDGSLVLCDKHNQKLKILNSKFECQSDVKLTGAPWDVAIVNENWVIATLPFARKLQFIHADLKEGFRMGRFIQTERMCWGVAVSNDDIFVTCHDNPGNGNIHILDKRGHVKKILGAQAEDTMYVLELPFYIAVNQGGDRIYVADSDLKRTITCLNRKKGGIVYDCSVCDFGYSKQSNSKAFQSPWSFKILIDDDEYVYANLGDKDMIQVFSDTGNKYKTLLTSKTELFGPHSMAFRERDSTMVIGLWDQVQTFRFKEIEVD